MRQFTAKSSYPYGKDGSKSYMSHFVSKSDVVRRPDRHAFAVQNGYWPILPYSVSSGVVKIRPSVVTTQVSYGSYWETRTFSLNQMSELGYNEANNWNLGNTISRQLIDHVTQTSLNRALTKVRDARISVGENVKDLGTTVQMCLDTFTRITRAYSALKKGNLTAVGKALGIEHHPTRVLVGRSRIFRDYVKPRERARALSKAAANWWLEYRYGWLPLYSDIYGTMSLIYDGAVGKRPAVAYAAAEYEQTVTSKLFRSGEMRDSVYMVDGADMSFQPGWTGVLEHYARCKHGFYYTVTSPGISTLQQCGVENPLSVMWNLLPLSFVADWFVNIGDFLASASTWVGKKYLSGFQSLSTQASVSLSNRVLSKTWFSGGTPYSRVSMTVGQMEAAQRTFNRTVITSPPLGVELRINPDLNLSRLLDAASLARQVFSS